MNTLLRVLSTLAGILFLVSGLRWIIDPAGAADALGMELLEGLGRSSQVGDMGAFFLAVAAMILVGVITLQRHWFYVPALMLLCAALLRILAWLLHDAALAGQFIVLEFVVGCLLLWTASRHAEQQ